MLEIKYIYARVKFFSFLFFVALFFNCRDDNRNVISVSGKKKQLYNQYESLERLEREKFLKVGRFIWRAMNEKYLYQESVPALADGTPQAEIDKSILRHYTYSLPEGAYTSRYIYLNSYFKSLLNKADPYSKFYYTPNKESELKRYNIVQSTYEHKILTSKKGKNVGYFKINTFSEDFDGKIIEINNLFHQNFSNIDELIIDLRENRGGFPDNANILASMVAKVDKNEIFNYEVFNKKHKDPETKTNRAKNKFKDAIKDKKNPVKDIYLKKLNLNRIVVLTSDLTASAAEEFIHSLKPYINVTTIGEKTRGKTVATINLYDSPNFTKSKKSHEDDYYIKVVINEVFDIHQNTYRGGIKPHIYFDAYDDDKIKNEALLYIDSQEN